MSSYLSHSGNFTRSLGPTPEEGSFIEEEPAMNALEVFEQFISHLGPPMVSTYSMFRLFSLIGYRNL